MDLDALGASFGVAMVEAVPITDAHQHLWAVKGPLTMSWLDAVDMPALKRYYMCNARTATAAPLDSAAARL